MNCIIIVVIFWTSWIIERPTADGKNLYENQEIDFEKKMMAMI